LTAATVAEGSRSRWRPDPGRLAVLLLGLWLFGTGEGAVVGAGLGNSPWTVLAQGASRQVGLSVGEATIAISFLVLVCWIPLRQAPGLGTILNAVVVGLAVDATLAVLPGRPGGALRVVELVGGIGLVAVGSGFYLGTELGPGPRDGLMTGLHRRTGRPLGAVRAGIELSALAVGFSLGGTVGIGTLAFALGIGPAVAWMLRRRRVLSPPARSDARGSR